MARSHSPYFLFMIGVLIATGMLSTPLAQAQISTPEQIAKQREFEKTIPKLEVTDEFLQLSIPGQTMGETVGVSRNSKGHLFVYTRTNPQGIARGGTAA